MASRFCSKLRPDEFQNQYNRPTLRDMKEETSSDEADGEFSGISK
jgi:hypothetical protein